MELAKRFHEAVAHSREFARRPDNESLLQLYALYKQAMEGDATDERPGGFDFKAIAKYDAWAALRGTPEAEAMTRYISLVEKMKEQFG